jgi:hypothetical protein
MTLLIRLETERGEQVDELQDRDELIAAVIPGIEDIEFHCWRFIDPYGDTVFNGLQMETFLVELDALQRRHSDPRTQASLARLERLARRCRDGVHLYLKFYGD